MIDRGAQWPHAPRAPLPSLEREFKKAIRQEPCKDLEYVTATEEPNEQETRMVEDRRLVNKLEEDIQELLVTQHPPPKARRGRQRQRLEVRLRNIPL